MSDDEVSTFNCDFLEDIKNIPIDPRKARELLRSYVKDVCGSMSVLERDVANMAFGVDESSVCLAHEEVAQKLNLSIEDVRDVLVKVLKLIEQRIKDEYEDDD